MTVIPVVVRALETVCQLPAEETCVNWRSEEESRPSRPQRLGYLKDFWRSMMISCHSDSSERPPVKPSAKKKMKRVKPKSGYATRNI